MARTPRLSLLRERLLELGGHEVVFHGPEPHLEALLDGGRLFPVAGRRRRFLADSECHVNSAKLWCESQGGVGIATGYGQLASGLWLPHSWGVERGRIVETTSGPWRRYFGVLLDDREALRFTISQFPTQLREQLAADAMAGLWPLSIVREVASEGGGR